MARTSCIRHPENDKMLQVRQWQIEACEGNHCAAFILAYFEYWTNVYHAFSEKSKQYQSMTVHSDRRRELYFSEDGTPIIPFSYDEITDGMLGLFSRRTVFPAVEYLCQRQFLIFHNIPVYFDRVNYYSLNINALHTFINDFYDSAKLHDGKCKIALSNSAKLHDEYIGKENKGEKKENKGECTPAPEKKTSTSKAEKEVTPQVPRPPLKSTKFFETASECFEAVTAYIESNEIEKNTTIRSFEDRKLNPSNLSEFLKFYCDWTYGNLPEPRMTERQVLSKFRTALTWIPERFNSPTNQNQNSNANGNHSAKTANSNRRGVKYTNRIDEFIEAACPTGASNKAASGFSIFDDNAEYTTFESVANG